MKTLAVILACVSLVRADQAADSFATGFANGLNQALYGQQNSNNNAQQVNVTTRDVSRPTTAPSSSKTAHYDAVNDQGTYAGMQFPTYGACRRYVMRSRAFVNCEEVP